jgi:small-conductance mechanosensitive channel
VNEVNVWLQSLGLQALPPIHRAYAIAAGALILAALALGVLAQRTIGPMLGRLWRDHAEGLGPRMPVIMRHGVTALVLALAINVVAWPPLAALMLGVVLGAAAALFSFQLLRGLGIPRLLVWLIALILFVAITSHAAGGLTPITHVLDRVGFDVGKRRFSLLAVITVLIVVVAMFASVRLVNRALGHWIEETDGLDATQKILAMKLAGIATIVAAFFIGIDLLDIDLTAFAVFGGALGLAVGFGLQKTAGNLIAGIILLMDRSIKPGDVIVVGDDVGRVSKIGVRAVSVITRDGKEHLIPNENLMTEKVENWSYSDRNVRIRIPVGVSYDCDLKLAQELMVRAASESPRVLDSPKPGVWLKDFGDNSVDHEILAWISDPESGVGNVRSDVLNRLWWLFKEHDIGLPYPQRDVHIKSIPEGLQR